MHWINVLAFILLLMSGLQIFNAHPALNWGKSSYNGRPPILQMEARMDAQGNPMGVTRIFGHEFNTTGVLGLSAGMDGQPTERGFPAWITLPGQQWLAMARRWHFFFAWVLVINGLAYLTYTLASRHLRVTSRPPGPIGVRSGNPSRTICAAACRRARPPGATTSCKNSLTSA